MRVSVSLFAALLVVVVLAACDEEAPATVTPGEPPRSPMQKMPPGHPDLPGQDTQRAPLRGKVVETMDAARYTYLRLETKQGLVWAAAGQTKLAVGDQVELSRYMPMQNFHSKALDRTFEEILFVSQLSVVGDASPSDGASEGPTRPPGHPVVGAPEERSKRPPGHPPVDRGTPETAPAPVPAEAH